MKILHHISTACTLALAFLLFSSFQNDIHTNPIPESIQISINTKSGNIRINNVIIQPFALEKTEAILGKPDRIEAHTFKSRYEYFGYGDNPSSSSMIEVTDYYYIYDELGLMFYTDNGMSTAKRPRKMSIHLGSERTFTNSELPPFYPHKAFPGDVNINEERLNRDLKMVPEGVNYNTDQFELLHVSFGPTSIATVIDRLYSIGADPYLMMYLDNEQEQKISYLEVGSR